MVVLINYADKNFTKAQKECTKSGLEIGGFDKVIEYSPKDIDSEFYEKNKKIFKQIRGAGLWLWKPYILKKVLGEINTGDIIFYSDAGVEFVSSVSPLIKLIDENNQDLIAFELQFLEKQYTKRDAFIILECDEEKFVNTRQRLATYFLIKKSKQTIEFVDKYLSYACDERILDEKPNVMGKQNYDGFITHRHDQSIFSLLTKKYGYKAFRDPSQWGVGFEQLYPTSNYGTLLNVTRKSNNQIKRRLLNQYFKLKNKYLELIYK